MSTNPSGTAADQVPAAIGRWIKTECGRAKYLQLAARPGILARLRLSWFVLIAVLRDLPARRDNSGTA